MSTRLEATPVAAIHLSEKQLARLRRRLVEDHVVQQNRAVELQVHPDLEPDLAEILLARCQEALEEIEAALEAVPAARRSKF